ncbi:RNA-binding protein 24-A isoform X1 [Selaginella moellendorffii]|uniref:RNA-binding protein 24-A isoform X1 n=1 Tax=Selaginella moellendorffii TaxID=88036 RepID=UPI000D1C5282|nr:RNA-binding protein 24-A isoform X1 [Selaginella moellendorffii]|eukprot:XP_002979581.2 RNA-binding protein 24-A isoform X1 [Selaginella moellendorffii]
MAEPQQGGGGGGGGSSHSQHVHHGGLGGSQFGDTTLTKIFVGGLAWETQRDTMRQYFEQFGEILEAVVITDKNTGRSKGYGFVTFKDPESARRACENPTPVIDGRRANCNLAALGVRPRFPPFHQGASRVRHFSPVLGSSQVGAASYSPGGASSSFPQMPAAPFSYPQAGFSYAATPYGYAYVPSEYSYQSLYPYGNPQLSAVYGGSSSGSSTISNPAAVYTYSGFNQIGSTYPSGGGQPYSPAGGMQHHHGHPQVVQYSPLAPTSPLPSPSSSSSPPASAMYNATAAAGASAISPPPSAGGASTTQPGLTTHPTTSSSSRSLQQQQQQQHQHQQYPPTSSSQGTSAAGGSSSSSHN